MNDLTKQYSKMVECATDLADFFLDQEGGAFTLAVVFEILQVLLQSGELSAASLVVETVCQVNESESPLESDKDLGNSSHNIERFITFLNEVINTGLGL